MSNEVGCGQWVQWSSENLIPKSVRSSVKNMKALNVKPGDYDDNDDEVSDDGDIFIMHF